VPLYNIIVAFFITISKMLWQLCGISYLSNNCHITLLGIPNISFLVTARRKLCLTRPKKVSEEIMPRPAGGRSFEVSVRGNTSMDMTEIFILSFTNGIAEKHNKQPSIQRGSFYESP
jgi:hypothetical protein